MTVPALLESARLANFRMGYIPSTYTARRATRAHVTVDDVPAKVRKGSVTIRDVLNDEPNTCDLTIDARTPPSASQKLQVWINSDTPRVLFNGTLQQPSLSYDGWEGSTPHTYYPCSAIDDTLKANRRLPFGTWTNISASTVARYLVQNFAPGFTANHVEDDLPPVSVNFDGSEGMNGCLKQLAKLVGGYFYWNQGDLHLFTEESDDLPDVVNDSTHRPEDDPRIRLITDDSQLRTRVYGKGHGETTLAEVPAGSTSIPVSDTVMFNAAGGQAISDTQILDYTGVQSGGGGALVGPGQSPSAAPAASAAGGVGLDAGVFQYEYTWVTASGQTLPSPLRSVRTGVIADPIVVSGSLYADTSVWTAQPGIAVGDTLDFSIQTSLDPYNTVGISNLVSVVTGFTVPAGFGGGSHAAVIHMVASVIADLSVSPVMYLHLFWRRNGGAWQRNLYEVASWSPILFDNGIFFFDGIAVGTPSPNVKQVSLSSIAAGPTGTTSRKIYRTAVNGTQPKLLATLADNTTTTYTDSTPDASLGANAPTSDTSAIAQAAGQVNAGATSLELTGVSDFDAAGGWAVVGNGQQVLRYTGISGRTLTGIPATGEGSIDATINYNSTASPAPALKGVSGLYTDLIKGAPVNVWVQRDDLAAQSDLAARDGSDGIVEHLIVDDRRGETSLIALCDADLLLNSRSIKTVPYATRDVKTKSGKPVTFDIATPAIQEDLTIQDVTITEIDIAEGLAPKFTATASTVRRSLENVLRDLSGGLGGL
jgi:hypothetical protein